MTLQIPTSDLQDSVLLSSLGHEDFVAMFAPARRTTYDAGQILFTEGEPGSSVFLIESGRVEVSITSLSGRKSIIAHMGPGEILGEIAALDGGGRSATVTAAKAMTGLVLPRSNVLAFIAERPEVAQAVIVELCKKVRNASDMFANRSVVEGGPRLAKALLRLFDKWGAEDGDSVVLTQAFSQTEIGDFGGLARENVNRYIKAWVAQDILDHQGGALVLLDRDRLEDLGDV
ncbi:MAG: Crp/Fnr family transcriptional regulator [Pseudomonadota bacterium]